MKITMLFRLGLVWAAMLLPAHAAENLPVVQKVFLPPRLQLGNTGIIGLQPIDEAAWIWHPDFAPVSTAAHADVFAGGWREPILLRFRRQFEADESPIRIHVSADERFELFLDGERIARGPDRSDVEHWSYATYELRLSPGSHRLEALVWSLGPYAPVAQLSWRGGFILKAEGDYDGQLTTGKAPWQVAKLEGYDFSPGIVFVGAALTAHDCGPQWKEGNFVKAQVVRGPVNSNPVGESMPGWKLFPTTLPDQLDREAPAGHAAALGSGRLAQDDLVTAEEAQNPGLPKWQALIDGAQSVTIPAQTEEFVLLKLDNYYCAYPECEVSGGAGAKMEWSWAESLYLPHSEAKGQRDEFIGKTFRGMTDTFLPGGGAHRKFTTLWWRAGRWCLLSIKTGGGTADDSPAGTGRKPLSV